MQVANRKRMSGCSQQQEKFVVVLFLVESGGCAHRFASGDIYNISTTLSTSGDREKLSW